MTYQNNDNTFINKYKPYFINDFSISQHLKETIHTLIDIDNLNLLFVGNPCSGKTTLLYAIIREYYGLSKTDSFPEHEILFINNLKEQGIQYFRNDMKTFCQSRSSIHGKKKLVIVDDIDSINEQSQQVFRNYLDKYKNNINFISVCCNLQKVIESMQSRTHIIKINQPSTDEIRTIMNKIIETENMVIDTESKDYLVNISENSIRLLINYLEKIYILGKPITIELCRQLVSNISYELLEGYFYSIKNKKLHDAIRILYSIHDYGYSVIDILDCFICFVKQTNILSEETKYEIIPFLCKYITVFHNIHEDGIELALFTNNLYSLFHS
jgi:DNA polymerase III delta prime subunit